jgi:hypothetical protein
MWLPSRAQVDSASRHAITAVTTAAAIFGLQAKGVDISAIIQLIQAMGPLVNDAVVVATALGPIYAAVKAMISSSQAKQIARVQAMATGPASDVAVDAQKALIGATSAIAQDSAIPKSEDAKNTLIAATIALPQVQTIITDKETARASPSPSVVSSAAAA